jgi:hypothetical protein
MTQQPSFMLVMKAYRLLGQALSKLAKKPENPRSTPRRTHYDGGTFDCGGSGGGG